MLILKCRNFKIKNDLLQIKFSTARLNFFTIMMVHGKYHKLHSPLQEYFYYIYSYSNCTFFFLLQQLAGYNCSFPLNLINWCTFRR